MPTNSLHFAADLYARFYSVYLFYSAFVLFIRLVFLCLPLLYFLSPVFVLVSVRPAVGPNQICHRPPLGHISPYLSYHRAVLSHVPLTNDPKKTLKFAVLADGLSLSQLLLFWLMQVVVTLLMLHLFKQITRSPILLGIFYCRGL